MNLESLDSLYAKSTPGTWGSCFDWPLDGGPNSHIGIEDGSNTCSRFDFTDDDLFLIVALHNSYPALRDRLRALEEVIEVAIDRFDAMRDYLTIRKDFNDGLIERLRAALDA